MKITETEIQSLKAQEAKDLAIQLLQELQAKDKGFISPGEVQLKELEYELKLKEAEFEDKRHREEHEERIRQLELQVERERTAQAEANSRAEQVRQEHSRLVEQVDNTMESLSVRLMRSTREHNLKLEKLEADYNGKREELLREKNELEAQRNQLQEEIYQLAELKETAEEISQLRDTLESQRGNFQQELEQLEEQAAAMEFERTKKISETKRSQEELEAQHDKQVLQLNREAADKILEGLGLKSISGDELERLQRQAAEQASLGDQQRMEVQEKTRAEVRKEFNITMPEAVDVTRLFYREQSLTDETAALKAQVEKLETEIRRMREHIEREPERIAKAVEAAKANVQNYIEQGAKR